jgi:uncharacterized membrane protein YgdD (TMEM256/DUF423 family)
MKLFLIIGAVSMALSIALGAFGAHGLAGKVTEKMLANWQTAAHYQMIHSLGLLLIGFLLMRTDSGLIQWAGWLLLVGILFFSGSLYTMVLTNVRALGAITPIGGTAFIIGWLLFAWGVAKAF